MLFVFLTIKVISKLLCKVEIRGQENIPHQGQVLFLLRHRSYLGVFLVETAMFYPWVLQNMAMFPMNVAKDKHVRAFEHLPVVGLSIGNWLTKHFNVLRLPEKAATSRETRSAIIDTEVKALVDRPNCSLVLFLTGTRDKPGEEGLPDFLPGIGRIVAETLPKIVFVWDQDTAAVWPGGKKLPRLVIRWWHGIPILSRHRVVITISQPIDANDPQATLQQICGSQPIEKVGRPVATYLRDLCWAWAVQQHPELENVAVANRPEVSEDISA